MLSHPFGVKTMTDAERRLWVEKCGKLLQDVLVEIRGLTWAEGHTKRINDLADLTHNIPQFMVGRDDFVLGYLRDGFIDYAKKYHPDGDPESSRYVMLLDMDEATFNDLYRADWREPADAR
jgi:hypothetical protein